MSQIRASEAFALNAHPDGLGQARAEFTCQSQANSIEWKIFFHALGFAHRDGFHLLELSARVRRDEVEEHPQAGEARASLEQDPGSLDGCESHPEQTTAGRSRKGSEAN